jgi:hypothetical protein
MLPGENKYEDERCQHDLRQHGKVFAYEVAVQCTVSTVYSTMYSTMYSAYWTGLYL